MIETYKIIHGLHDIHFYSLVLCMFFLYFVVENSVNLCKAKTTYVLFVQFCISAPRDLHLGPSDWVFITLGPLCCAWPRSGCLDIYCNMVEWLC